jgi:hypothetical protein
VRTAQAFSGVRAVRVDGVPRDTGYVATLSPGRRSAYFELGDRAVVVEGAFADADVQKLVTSLEG